VHGGTVSWQDPLNPDESYEGPVLGAQLAHEGERVGIGAGLVQFTGRDGGVSPSLYLRFGRLAETMCRLEFMPPEPALGSVGWLRIGFGHEMGRARRTGWLAGAQIGPGHDQAQWSFTTGLRWTP
jgi:hypothetical protein